MWKAWCDIRRGLECDQPNSESAWLTQRILVSHANWRIDSMHPCGRRGVTLDEGSSVINLILNPHGSVNVSYGTHVSEMNLIK